MSRPASNEAAAATIVPRSEPRADGRVAVCVGHGRVQLVDPEEAEALLRQMEREELGD